jgi:hypothetical protein
MLIRRALPWLLGLGLVATLTTALSGTLLGGAAAADSEPLLADGTVRTASGAPRAGVLVVASAEHDRGARTIQTELARDTTDAAGRFELEGALTGPARIEIMTLASDVVRYHLVDAGQPMRDLSLTLQAGTTEPATGGHDRMVTTSSRTAATAVTTSRAGAAMIRADPREAQLVRACPTFGDIYWKETSTTVKRGVPVHFAYVANKTTHRFEYETTTSTSFSIAYTGVGKDYEGGLTGSEQNDTSAGLVGTKGGGSPYTPFVWKLQWQFRKEDKWCFNMGYPYPMGRSRWLPVRWTGGNWTSHDATTFPCNPDHRAGSSHDFWVQRSTSSTWTGWFAIAGVKLSSSQERGSRIKATYVLRRGMGRMVLCGRDDAPPYASFVVEVAST